MNCQTIQHRILGLADPAELTGSLAEHVAQCPECARWHRLLTQIEYAVGHVTVPAHSGQAKAKLLAEFQPQKPTAAIPKTPAKVKPARDTKPLGVVTPKAHSWGDRIAKMWPAGIIAGIICVGVGVWSNGKRKQAPEVAQYNPDPLLDRVVTAKVQLDTAKSTPDRMKVLAKLADDVQEQAKNLYLVSPGEEMTSLSKMYGDIVIDGLVFQAETLDEQERRQLLADYTERLAKAEQQAERLAAEAPIGSDQPLRDIAKIAREGKNKLAKLREKSL